MTDAQLLALLRPHVARIVEAVRAKARPVVFAADADDGPTVQASFSAADVARLSDYFDADYEGRYPPTLHRKFGMGQREFADAAQMRQVYTVGGDGKGVLYWAKRGGPEGFADQGHKPPGPGGGQFTKGNRAGGNEGERDDSAAPVPPAAADEKGAAAAVAAELGREHPALKDRIGDAALTAAAHAYRAALQFAHSPWAERLGDLLGAVFDTPADLQKLGYNPSSGGVAAPGVLDPVKEATGLPGHLVASIASKVITKALFALKDQLKGKPKSMSDGDADWRDGVADLLCDLYDSVHESLGLPPVEWETVRAALDAAPDVRQFSAAPDTFAAAKVTWSQGQNKKGEPGWVSSGGQFRKNKPAGADQGPKKQPRAAEPAEPQPKKAAKPAAPTKGKKAAKQEQEHQAVRADLTAAFANPAAVTPDYFEALARNLAASHSAAELKALARERGAKLSGTKAQLVQSIVHRARSAIQPALSTATPAAPTAPHQHARTALDALGIPHSHLSDEDVTNRLKSAFGGKKEPKGEAPTVANSETTAKVSESAQRVESAIEQSRSDTNLINNPEAAAKHADDVISNLKADHTPDELKVIAKRTTGKSGRTGDEALNLIRTDLMAVSRLRETQRV